MLDGKVAERVAAPTKGRPGTVFLGLLLLATTTASAGVATALPTVVAALGLDSTGSAWLMAVYATGFAVATLVFGRAIDVFGLRAAMVWGLVLIAVGSLLCLSAWSLPVLLVGRAVQGAGGGAVPVVASAALVARADARARRQGLGVFTALMTLSSATVPVLAGGLAQLAGWRSLFAVSALIALALMPAARAVPADPRAPGRLEATGVTGVVALVGGLMLGLRGAVDPRTSAPWVLPVACALVLAGAVLTHRRGRSLLPLGLLRDRRTAIVVAAGFVLFGAYFGLQLAIPLLLDADHHWSPTHIGLVLLPVGVGGALGSWAAGRGGVWGSPSVVLLASGGAGGAALGCAAAWASVPWVLVGAFAMVSAMIGAGNVVLVGALADAVPARVHGAVLGLYNIVFYLGGSVTAVVEGRLLGVSATVALGALALLPPVLAALAVVWPREAASECASEVSA